MWYHQKVDPTTFDEMIPWEKNVFVQMLVAQVEEENEKIRLREQERKIRQKMRTIRR